MSRPGRLRLLHHFVQACDLRHRLQVPDLGRVPRNHDQLGLHDVGARVRRLLSPYSAGIHNGGLCATY